MKQLKNNFFGQILGFHYFHFYLDNSTSDLIGQEKVDLWVSGWLLFFCIISTIFERTSESLHLFIFFVKLFIINSP